jgi:hypothetical protein
MFHMHGTLNHRYVGKQYAEYPAVNLSAQTSPNTRRRGPSIVYARAASQRGSYLASIVMDLHTTLYIV